MDFIVSMGIKNKMEQMLAFAHLILLNSLMLSKFLRIAQFFYPVWRYDELTS